jgi:hypothetical protein
MTAELIRYILRAVNIPAYKAYRDSHAMAFFPTWGRVLLHADDPYKPFSGNVFTGFASCMSLPAVTYTMDTIQFLNMSVYIVEAGGYLLQGVNQQIYKWDRMVQYLIFEFSPYLLLLVCQDWKDSGDAFWPGGDPTVEMPKVEKFISDKLYQIGPETLDVVKNAAIFGPTGDQPYVVAAREKLDELIESEFPEVHECLELKGSVACLDDLIDWLFDLVYPEFGAEPCPSGNGHSFCTKELQICGGNCK